MTEQEKAWKAYSSNDTLRPSSYECFQAGWLAPWRRFGKFPPLSMNTNQTKAFCIGFNYSSAKKMETNREDSQTF